jgi:hypothetical protein
MQQLAQDRRSCVMHRCPHGHLDRFEVQLTGLATVLKDDPEQAAYFSFDFLPDRFRRFFSWALSESSRGLMRQMFSFVSINVPLNS